MTTPCRTEKWPAWEDAGHQAPVLDDVRGREPERFVVQTHDVGRVLDRPGTTRPPSLHPHRRAGAIGPDEERHRTVRRVHRVPPIVAYDSARRVVPAAYQRPERQRDVEGFGTPQRP